MKKKNAEALDGHIGRRLRAQRKSQKLSLEELGELIDVSAQQLSRYELGTNRISAGQLYQLARGLGVSVGWFYEDYEEDAQELQRIATVLHEGRGKWTPQRQEDEEERLIDAFRRLPTPRHKNRFLSLMELIAIGA